MCDRSALFFLQELRITGILITVTGIIYFSVIMGFIVDVIRITMDDLKKGKSKVTEQGHTVSVVCL